MIRAADQGVLVSVSVVPGARSDGIIGEHGGRVKVRVSAPPERGKANEAVVALLVVATGASSGRVVAGHAHRFKSILLEGVDVESVKGSLDAP